MSSSDKTKISTSIPTFNGTNYREWADAVKSFMRYSGVWFLIEGYGSDSTSKVPGMARPTLTTTTPNNAAEIASWDEKNDKALGTIMIYVAANLKHHVTDKYMALEAWTTLQTEYEKPEAVGAFVAFQKLFNAVLSDRSALGPQIDSMIEASTQVNNAGIAVTEQLVALLIVNSLPTSYQTIAGTILSTSADVTKLKLKDIKPKIVEEEQRRVANQAQISRVSTAPQHSKYCDKCKKETNHTTEQH